MPTLHFDRYDCPLYMTVSQQVEKYIPANDEEESRWEPDADYNDVEVKQAYVGRVSILVP
jgi:hypothetical protein